MKFLLMSIIFTCFVFPAFSQTSRAQQRYTTLGDTMGASVTRTTATLAEFDSMTNQDGQVKVFTDFLRRYNNLNQALDRSELRMNFLLRANVRVEEVAEERDNYDSLVKQLQALKNDYDNWLRTVR